MHLELLPMFDDFKWFDEHNRFTKRDVLDAKKKKEKKK